MSLKAVFGPAILVAGLATAATGGAQSPSPAPNPAAAAATSVPRPPSSAMPASSLPAVVTPAPGLPAARTPVPEPAGPIVPGSLSGAAQPTPVAVPGSTLPRAPAASPAPAARPSPDAAGPNPTSPGRFRIERPGSDVEGDSLSGNVGSDVYAFHGNVVLHSDPRIDRAFGSSTESNDPILLTADEVDVDRAALTYVAKGHVHFVQGTRSGRADVGTLNEQTHDLDLIGHADVIDGERRVRADKMHYNTLDRRFHGAGDVRIYQPVPSPNPKASSTAAPKRRRRLPLPL